MALEARQVIAAAIAVQQKNREVCIEADVSEGYAYAKQ